MKKGTVNWFGDSTVQRFNRPVSTCGLSSRDDGDDVGRENEWPAGKSWRKGKRLIIKSQHISQRMPIYLGVGALKF